MRVPVEGAQVALRGGVAARRAEVEAGAEERTGPGEDDGADRLVALGRREGRGEVGEERLVDRVRGRAIERQHADAAVAILVAYRRGHRRRERAGL